MRAAILGALVAEQDLRRALVDVSSRITHRDACAIAAARAVADRAAWIMAGADREEELWKGWRGDCDHPAWSGAMTIMRRAADRRASVDDLAADLGQPNAVTGYACTSVPLALYAWWLHRSDLASILSDVHRCGGDVDTIGAIAGALSGLEGGVATCPPDWLGRIIDRPLTVGVLRRQAKALAEHSRPVRWWWIFQPVRGLLVLLIVIGHGLMRLAR